MRDHGTAAFADDIGMRDLLRITDVRDIINDVVCVFLEGVIGGAVECGTAAIVVHSQPAADIQEFNLETHLVELGVKPRGLLHSSFYNENIRDLGTDMKMKQFEAMSQVLGFEHFG